MREQREWEVFMGSRGSDLLCEEGRGGKGSQLDLVSSWVDREKTH